MRWCRNPCINLWGFVAFSLAWHWHGRARKEEREEEKKKGTKLSALIFGTFSGRNNIFYSECFSKPTSRPERGENGRVRDIYLFHTHRAINIRFWRRDIV
jgi:hypothetical protein